MAKCKYCGSELPEGAKVCFSCKREVNEPQDAINTLASDNKVANVIRIIGITVIFLGINIGIISAVYIMIVDKSKFSVLLGLRTGVLIILGSVVSGFLYLGLSEIIRLLQSINDKMNFWIMNIRK